MLSDAEFDRHEYSADLANEVSLFFGRLGSSFTVMDCLQCRHPTH